MNKTLPVEIVLSVKARICSSLSNLQD